MRTVLVTGGNTGIGLETAIALARRGDDVIVTSRDARKGAAALDRIRRESGRSASAMPLDLASTRSIRAFAERFLAERPRLDVLVLNAGLILDTRRVTEDGFEEMLGVNHLGHFLLTRLLLPRLLASAPARVIVVSSNAHRRAKQGLDFQDLMNARRFEPFVVYGQSKLANLYFARELGRRLAGSGVVAHSLHPGVVATEFAGADDGRGLAYWAFRLGKPFLKTPAEGAATTIFLATSESAMQSTGLYYVDCEPATPKAHGGDDAAARLWEKSEELLGLPPMRTTLARMSQAPSPDSTFVLSPANVQSVPLSFPSRVRMLGRLV